jgi:hypothetical protein
MSDEMIYKALEIQTALDKANERIAELEASSMRWQHTAEMEADGRALRRDYCRVDDERIKAESALAEALEMNEGLRAEMRGLFGPDVAPLTLGEEACDE